MDIGKPFGGSVLALTMGGSRQRVTMRQFVYGPLKRVAWRVHLLVCCFLSSIHSRNLWECVGHGWDVKCVEWHPTKGLLVSGSKDNLIKFWDPRTGTVLSTL